MHQLSDYTTKLLSAAMPQRGLERAQRESETAKASVNKIVVRALEAVRSDLAGASTQTAPEAPPSTMPLQLRPANRLGNLHRLQDLLTEFLHPQTDN